MDKRKDTIYSIDEFNDKNIYQKCYLIAVIMKV